MAQQDDAPEPDPEARDAAMSGATRPPPPDAVDVVDALDANISAKFSVELFRVGTNMDGGAEDDDGGGSRIG